MAALPPLNALRAFDAAGRHLSFRAAADALGVTQGAVAQQVRAVEAHLGMPLFERYAKGLAFTPSGRGYHARVAFAFADLRAATDALRATPEQVLVSVPPSFASKWLIPNLPTFAQAHPGIELRILATEAVSRFHADGIDLAVRQGPPPRLAGLEVVRLFRSEIVAVCAPSILSQDPSDDADGRLARLPKLHDAHDLWPAFLRHAGIGAARLDGPRFNLTALAIDAALAGQGAALVDRFLVTRDLAAGHLVQVAAPAMEGVKHFHLVARRADQRGDAVTAAFGWFRTMGQDGV